jgi:hypothetical protein
MYLSGLDLVSSSSYWSFQAKPSVDTCLNQFIFWPSYFHLVGPQKDLLKIGMLYFLSLNLKRNTHCQVQVSFLQKKPFNEEREKKSLWIV